MVKPRQGIIFGWLSFFQDQLPKLLMNSNGIKIDTKTLTCSNFSAQVRRVVYLALLLQLPTQTWNSGDIRTDLTKTYNCAVLQLAFPYIGYFTQCEVMRFKFLDLVRIFKFLCWRLASDSFEMVNDGGVPADGLQCLLISASQLTAWHEKIGVSERCYHA